MISETADHSGTTPVTANHGPDRRNVLKSTLALGLAGSAGVASLIKPATSFAQQAAHPLGPQVTLAGLTALKNSLYNLATSGAAINAFVQAGAVLTDPSLFTLANNTLNDTTLSLTGYQKDLAQAYIDISSLPFQGLFSSDVTETILQGGSLPQAIAQDVINFNETLDAHPSIHLMRAAGTQVLYSASLAKKVSEMATVLTTPVSPVSTADPVLSALLATTSKATSSSDYTLTAQRLAALMGQPGFIALLQSGQVPPEIGAVLLPPGTIGSFSLPLGDNPDASNSNSDIIGSALLIVGSAVAGYYGYSVALASGATLATVLLETVAIVGVVLGVFALFEEVTNAAEPPGTFTPNPFEE